MSAATVDSTAVLVRLVQLAQEMNLPTPHARRLVNSDCYAVDFKGTGEALRFDGDMFTSPGWELSVRRDFRDLAIRMTASRTIAVGNASRAKALAEKTRHIEQLNADLLPRQREFLESPPRARAAFPLNPRPSQTAVAMTMYTDAQRECSSRPLALSVNAKALASAEWSRQLRELQAAAKHRESHQVLCDLQDEP